MAETIHERIARLLYQQGKQQNELAEFCEVSPQAVHQWLGQNKEKKPRGPAGKHHARIAAFFNVTVDYLVSGRNGIQEDKSSIINIDTHQGRDVPLLPLDQLTDVNSGIVSEFRASMGMRVQTRHRVSTKAVAFALQDTSMEPRFSQNDIIVIDPEVNYDPGEYVAAHIKSLGINVFRQFIYDGAEHRVLAAVNPQHRSYRFTHKQWEEDVVVIGPWTERHEVNTKAQKRHTS